MTVEMLLFPWCAFICFVCLLGPEILMDADAVPPMSRTRDVSEVSYNPPTAASHTDRTTPGHVNKQDTRHSYADKKTSENYYSVTGNGKPAGRDSSNNGFSDEAEGIGVVSEAVLTYEISDVNITYDMQPQSPEDRRPRKMNTPHAEKNTKSPSLELESLQIIYHFIGNTTHVVDRITTDMEVEPTGDVSTANSTKLPVAPTEKSEMLPKSEIVRHSGEDSENESPDTRKYRWEPYNVQIHHGSVDTRLEYEGIEFWGNQRYLISVFVPIAVGVVGAASIVLVAFVMRSYRRKKRLRLVASASRNLLRPQYPQIDHAMLLDEVSDDGF